jgi:hypothetical protein
MCAPGDALNTVAQLGQGPFRRIAGGLRAYLDGCLYMSGCLNVILRDKMRSRLQVVVDASSSRRSLGSSVDLLPFEVADGGERDVALCTQAQAQQRGSWTDDTSCERPDVWHDVGAARTTHAFPGRER